MSSLTDSPMVRAESIRVDYAEVAAVKNVDLSIGPGEVYGLIGPNGAGKSSLIRVLATLQEPTHGRVWIDGIDAEEHPAAARRVLGYMPDLAPVYKDLKCWEFLDLFAAAYFMPRRDRQRRVGECLEAVGLTAKRDAMAGTLSRGMTQRLTLAKTILPRPKMLLLDEPASGIDPVARIQMRTLLKSLAADGQAVLVSSHILTELSEFCTSVGIMQRGEMILSGRVDEVIAGMRTASRYRVEFAQPVESVLVRLEAYAGVTDVALGDKKAEFSLAGSRREASELLAALVREGLPVCGFAEQAFGMEDVMMRLGAEETS